MHDRNSWLIESLPDKCKLSDKASHAWNSWKTIIETSTWNLQLTLTCSSWLLMSPDVHYFPSCHLFFRMTENSRQKWPWKKERAFDTVKTAGVEIHTLWQVVSGKLKFIVKRWSTQKAVLVSQFSSLRDFALSSSHESPCPKMVCVAYQIVKPEDDQAKK